MSHTIQWLTPLDSTGRRWLRSWLRQVTAKHRDLIQRRRGAIVVRGGTPEAAHSFAALTMAILDRPRFAYTLTSVEEPFEVRAAA